MHEAPLSSRVCKNVHAHDMPRPAPSAHGLLTAQTPARGQIRGLALHAFGQVHCAAAICRSSADPECPLSSCMHPSRQASPLDDRPSMRTSALLLSLAVLLPAASAQAACYMYHGCTECVVQPHCGWCPTASSCWTGTAAGPANPQQNCATEDWNFETCTALRLQDGQRVSVRDPKGGFYEYFDFTLIYAGQDVTVAVDNGGVVSNRRLFASQEVSLPRSNRHTWEGKVRGSLIELKLGRADGLDYTKPLFLSVLNDVSVPYSILAEMVPPSSGGELMSCSFDVSNTTFPTASALKATAAISELCGKTSKSGDAFVQRLVNDPSPLAGWEVVGVVVFEIYKGLLKYSTNLTDVSGDVATLAISATSPYPYQGPKVLTMWRRRGKRAHQPVVSPQPGQVGLASAGLGRPTARVACSINPGWVVEGHSSSLDERTQSWITTVFNKYLCGSMDRPDTWAWDGVRELGIVDTWWTYWMPFQTQSGFQWTVNAAVALDRPEVHWVWVSQSARSDNGRPHLFLYVALDSVPLIPDNLPSA